MENSSHFQINDYLKPGRHAHLVGIGGVSMRPLGLVLRSMGMQISGSDMNASVSTDELMAKGIAVSIGHRAENIEGADCVIRTAAANNDNPEIAAARAAGIPIFERAQAWGYIMKAYRHAICVSGTHGKTTTTSMLTQIFMEAGKDPTVMIGGSLPLLGAGHRVGQGDTIILESCEYCNSFLNFFPTTAVVLDIDADHLDFFKDLEDVKHSFRRFAELVPANGLIVANGDDKNTLDALDGLSLVRFGMAETNDVYGTNFSEDYRCFDVVCGGKPYCHLELGVIGRHNAMNALAACAVCWKFSIPAEAVQRALHEFHGAGRRLEFKGRYHGADVYDDYSHHPAELHALLSAVRLMGYRRVICAFQPHTYSRTKALFSDFVRELSAADLAVLTDIYAARESNTIGISSKDLADQIPGSVYCPGLPQLTDYLAAIAQPGDIIRTVGAGDPSVPVHPGELDPEMEVQSVGGDFNGITRWREKWFGTSHRAHIEVNTASGVITFLNDPAYWVLLPQASAELLVQRAPLQIYELTDPPELWNIYLLRSQRSQTRSTAVCRAFEQELTDFLAGRAQPSLLHLGTN